MSWRAALLLAGASAMLAGCASVPTLSERAQRAGALAASKGWSEVRLQTPSFEFEAFAAPDFSRQDDLVIYIEGDGLAFLSQERVSDDPTPLEPVALQMALSEPANLKSNVVYLARPCQYTGMNGLCRASYWSGQRFAPEVISAMNDAVSQLKMRYGASRLTLVGYSGGAAVAALLAERRDDVVRLVSAAGNLSTVRWIALQNLSPMTGSLDPYDQRSKLVGISQWHFVGGSDNVVPPSLTDQFVAGFADAKVTRIDGFNHLCCWAERWPELWLSINQ